MLTTPFGLMQEHAYHLLQQVLLLVPQQIGEQLLSLPFFWLHIDPGDWQQWQRTWD
jgi:hypothetical protein